MNLDHLQEITDRRKTIGDLGEDFALSYERQRLHGHPMLSSISIIGRGDIGMGYDILSFESINSTTPDRYIEVKTYTGEPHFFFSQGEYAAAQKYGIRYYIYLIDSNRISTPGYEPIIIRDPIHTLANDSQWNEKIQNREYSIANTQTTALPGDLDSSTVLIGCFNTNQHLNWILHNYYYNVRQEDNINGWQVNGGVRANETAGDVRYLILYNVREPRTYSVYSVTTCVAATRSQLLQMNYPSPHCQRYLLYRLKAKVPFPPLDIMQLLRTNNDKRQRTSGTPILISGTQLRRYLLTPSLNGTAPKRTFTNNGKPWTAVQRDLLTTLFQSGVSIAAIAHKLYRTPEEIHAQLRTLNLE